MSLGFSHCEVKKMDFLVLLLVYTDLIDLLNVLYHFLYHFFDLHCIILYFGGLVLLCIDYYHNLLFAFGCLILKT